VYDSLPDLLISSQLNRSGKTWKWT